MRHARTTRATAYADAMAAIRNNTRRWDDDYHHAMGQTVEDLQRALTCARALHWCLTREDAA